MVQLLCLIHSSRNYDGNLLATWWQPMVAGDCHHIALRRQWLPVHCQCVATIANGCQRLATFSNCLKKLPSVAVVTCIVNMLRISLQMWWQLHSKAVTNGRNVLMSNGNAVTTRWQCGDVVASPVWAWHFLKHSSVVRHSNYGLTTPLEILVFFAQGKNKAQWSLTAILFTGFDFLKK